MMKHLIVCLVIIGIIVVPSLSDDVPPGVGAASFARIGADACPMAMGGAYVAVNEGNPIAYYNPAQLAKPSTLGLGSMYSQIGGADLGVTFHTLDAHGYLGTQTPSFAGVGVGATWLRMEIADIPLWNEDSPDRIEYFTSTSSVFLFSGAIKVVHWLATGASVKIYQERILEGIGDGIGLDVGLLGSFTIQNIPVTVGLNSIDLGKTIIKWHNTTGEPVNYVPWVNKIGLATRPLDKVLILGDFDWAVGRPLQEQTIHLGFEVSPLPIIALRGGWNTKIGRTGNFSVGMGIQLFNFIDIDYAYLPEGNLGITHVVSANLSF
jgi:hypothetical protein